MSKEQLKQDVLGGLTFLAVVIAAFQVGARLANHSVMPPEAEQD